MPHTHDTTPALHDLLDLLRGQLRTHGHEPPADDDEFLRWIRPVVQELRRDLERQQATPWATVFRRACAHQAKG